MSARALERPTFEVLAGPDARELLSRLPTGPFQHPGWVQAVAAARARPHVMLAVRACVPGLGECVLAGASHRRLGWPVFESMPMGGYGGWVTPEPLAVEQERDLNRAWLARARWPLVMLTSMPGRAQALPAASSAMRWIPPRQRALVAPRGFATHLLDLRGDDAALAQRTRGHMRSHLRRFNVLGIELDVSSGADALRRVHRWYRAGSDAWQQPSAAQLPLAYFTALAGARAEVWTAKLAGREVGAALFLLGAGEIQYQASGSERIKGPLGAMDAILWAAMRQYRDRGYVTMNFGASDGLDSVARFKEKFGAHAAPYLRVGYLMPSWLGTRSAPALPDTEVASAANAGASAPEGLS